MKYKALTLSLVLGTILLVFSFGSKSNAQIVDIDNIILKFFEGNNVFIHWHGTKGDPGLKYYERFDPISGLYKDKLETYELFCAFPQTPFLPRIFDKIPAKDLNTALKGFYMEIRRANSSVVTVKGFNPSPTSDVVYARIIGRGPYNIPGQVVCSPAVLRTLGIDSTFVPDELPILSDERNYLDKAVNIRLIKRSPGIDQIYRDQSVFTFTDQQFGI